jgi:hypothetical protein
MIKKLYISYSAIDLEVFPLRKAGFKMLFLLCKQTITLKIQLMSNVLTKQVQNKVSRYFLKLENHLTKPESRCVREMTTGILKSGTVLVNKIATGICDNISLSQTTKRFRNHYNKKNFFMKLFRGHRTHLLRTCRTWVFVGRCVGN